MMKRWLNRIGELLGTAPSEPLVTRAIGALAIAGGALVLLSLLLPHPPGDDNAALTLISAAAIAIGVSLIVVGPRLPGWVLQVVIAAESALACTAVYLSGVAAAIYALTFVWIAVFVAFFFPPRVVAAQVGFLLASYAVVLATVGDTSGYSPVSRWLLTAVVVVGTGAIVSSLVSRGRAADERARQFFQLSRDLICTAERDGTLAAVNPAWRETLAYDASELRSRPLTELVHPDDLDRTEAEIARSAAGGGPREFEARLRTKDGRWLWFHWSMRVGGRDGLVYARGTDISGRKRAEANREFLVHRLDSMARTDPLTGLPNRRWLAEELRREMGRAGRAGTPLCAAMLDLDGFKGFNDREGHPAGDELLRRISDRWREAMRSSDFLARYGGDEFVVILPECTLESAVGVIDGLRAKTREGQACSAGVALWDGEESPGALVARADRALYAAKEEGGDRLARAEPPGADGGTAEQRPAPGPAERRGDAAARRSARP